MGATEKIAQFLVQTTFEDIPRQAIDLAKRTALDTLAAAMAGSSEPGSQAVVHYVKTLGSPPQASVIGGGFRTEVADAALANGTMAHALDYDPYGMRTGHPCVMVLPAVLALGDWLRASGREVLTAYVLGLEVEGKVALHGDYKRLERSLNQMSWYGSLGAAAACARLLRLDVRQTRMALGIAANLACGLTANHGTMLVPVGAGNAGRSGVVAALMSREGVTANPGIIEARNGFCETLVGPGRYDTEGMSRDLGNPFYIVSPGIGLKKYPCGLHAHRAIDALFKIMDEHSLTDGDIAGVDVGMSERALHVLPFHDPATPYEAMFSMPFCIAAALVDRRLTLDTFAAVKLHDAQIVHAMQKVTMSRPYLPIWPGSADVGPGTVFVGNPVTVRTVDGRSYSNRVDVLRGDPAQPLSDEHVLGKYRDCAQHLLDPADIQRSSELVLALDQVPDVRELTDILSASEP
ncbi:MAG: MmgE/PrpD family protein [Chloroflexi bacterium]|nr:MmgE/PrpD family protein [Chloroflexota bacterium]